MFPVNQLTINGRVGADASLNYTKNNFPIGEFRIAHSVMNAKKEYVAHWFSVRVLGKFAESVVPQIKKGVPVIVSGKMQSDQWTGKDGKMQTRVTVLADTVFVVARDNSGAQAPEPGPDNYILNQKEIPESDLQF